MGGRGFSMDQPMLSLAETRRAFRHEALFYAGEDEFLAETSSFVREGLEADEPALVMLEAPKIESLQAELNGDADRVFFADMSELGRNPARIIPAWRTFVDRHSGYGTGVRGIGEPISARRDGAELAEYQHQESLLNLAFADAAGFTLMCPYDTEVLDDAVLEEARRSHSVLLENGDERASPDCRDLAEVAAPFARPLPDPPGRREWRVFYRGSLPSLREWVGEQARAWGIDGDGCHALVLAAHEVATNSVLHGGGGGICRIWTEGDTLVCELRDKGTIDSPLAGRERPVPGEQPGCGLWLANHLCDLVQIRSFADGSVVRLHKRRD
jgi:anti-sigma regulatory factor (Ser/Thr protein kinase)